MPKAKRAIPQPHADRITRLRERMRSRRLDAYLVQNRNDQYWLTGFTGEDGSVLVTARSIVLLTDGRFDETADLEAPFARKVLRKRRTPDVTAREIRKRKPARVGYDVDHTTVRTFTELGKLIRPAKLVSTSRLILDMRQCKDEGELGAIRRAIRYAEEAFECVREWVRVGMTERQVAAKLVFEMQRLGADGSSFEPIVAVGANSSLPHYAAGDAVVTDDAGILIDWGARSGWYVSDLTRMIWPGSIPRRLRNVYAIVREAHDLAIAAVGPGVKGAAVDRVAREHIRKFGYGKQFRHGLGHGIGLDVHESPRLGNKSDDVLKPGMVLTIEPGIYLPGVGGIRIEDDVLVTENGYEVLSSLPTDLVN
jgi:Xaa-Pro aminopeptidase